MLKYDGERNIYPYGRRKIIGRFFRARKGEVGRGGCCRIDEKPLSSVDEMISL